MKSKDYPKREKKKPPQHRTMEKVKVHQYLRRAGWKNRHHMIPKSRGGDNSKSNKLMLDVYRHNAWHLLFGNLTYDEIISLLERLKALKESQELLSVGGL